jgi:hypothetical protein
LEARIFWVCEVDGFMVEINNEEVATVATVLINGISATKFIKLTLVVVRIGFEASIKIDKFESENQKQNSSLISQKAEQLFVLLHFQHTVRFLVKQSVHFLLLEFKVQQIF